MGEDASMLLLQVSSHAELSTESELLGFAENATLLEGSSVARGLDFHAGMSTVESQKVSSRRTRWSQTGCSYYKCAGTASKQETVSDEAECQQKAEAVNATSYLFTQTSSANNGGGPLCAIGVDCGYGDAMPSTSHPWAIYSDESVTTGCCCSGSPCTPSPETCPAE